MRCWPLILLPLLAAGCAATPAQHARDQAAVADEQQRLAARLAGLTRDHDTDCISPYRSDTSSEGFGRDIVYRVNSSLMYVNHTTGGCEGIERGDILVTESPEGRLCKGDMARTIQPTARIPTGSCALGDFTVYKKP